MKDEDRESLARIENLDSLILFGLLPNEHRMSALHFVMHRANNYSEEIKNKTELTFVCGFRRFKCRPIFSAHTNANKVSFAESHKILFYLKFYLLISHF